MNFAEGYVLGSIGAASLSWKKILLESLGWTLLMFGGTAAIVVPCVIESEKQLDEKMANLNATVAASMDYKEADVQDFKCDISKNNEFLFEFSGNAINSYDEKIDFFSCSYKVDAQQYKEINDYIIKNDYEDRKLRNTATDLIEKITDIVASAELVEKKENANVVTSAKSEKSVILNVSKPKIKGDKVSYYVAHLEEGKDKKGQLGLTHVLTEVSYELTKELKENPNAVFALDKEQAQVKQLSKKFEPVKQLEVKAYRGR